MRARLRQRSATLLIASVLVFCVHSGLRAQESPSGSIERSARLLETYRAMLDEDPTAEYPFRRLLETAHVKGGVKGLIELYLTDLDSTRHRYARFFVVGHLYRASEQDKKALDAYSKAAEARPRSADPHVAIARLHRHHRRFEVALNAFDRAIDLVRKRESRQEILKAAATTALEGKDIARATLYYDALVKTEPRNLFLRMEYAGNLVRAGFKKRALALWLELKERSRSDLKNLIIILREAAELQTSLKQYDAAEKTWRDGLARLPDGHWARPTFLEGLVSMHRRQDRLKQLIDEWMPKTQKSYQILVTVAHLQEELANDQEALRLYAKALKRRPKDANARLRMIHLLERVGRVDDVIAAYRELIKATRGEARYEIRLAELYFSRGRTRDGMASLSALSRAYRNDPGVHQSVIDLLVRYGDQTSHSTIESEYRILMKLEPREESHPISLGELYWTQGDRKRALAMWKKLPKVSRRKAEGHFLLAEVYANHGLTQKASESFQEAIRLEPKNPRYRQAYASLLEKGRKFSAALSQWKQVLTEAGKRQPVYSREARRRVIAIWERSGRLEQEIARLETDFARLPVDPEVGAFLGAIYVNLRRSADAERVFARVLSVNPNHVEALSGLELVLTRQNRTQESIDILYRLAALNSRQATDYLHRAADLALSMGKQEQALDCMRKVVELNPADPQAHTRVAELHQRMGSLREAAEAWRQALRLDPRNYRNQFRLAGIYRELGNSLREEQVLTDIVRTANEPSDILKAGRLLLSVAVTTDRVSSVEEIIRPLVFNRRNRDLFLHLLIDVYATLAKSHAYANADSSSTDRLADLGRRALKPLLDGLLSPDVTLRNKALNVISMTRPSAVGNALARLLKSKDRELQFRAVYLLGRLRTNGAVDELSRVATSGGRDLRRLATWALGLIESEESVQALIDLLNEGSIDVRPIAALALGQFKDGSQREVLEQTALMQRNPMVRMAAIWSLGRIGSSSSFGPLAIVGRRLKKGTHRPSSSASDTKQEQALIAWAMGRTRPKRFVEGIWEGLWSHSPSGFAFMGPCLTHHNFPQENERLRLAYEHFVDSSSMRFLKNHLRFVLQLPACVPGGDLKLVAELRGKESALRRVLEKGLMLESGQTDRILASFLGDGNRLAIKPYLSGTEGREGDPATTPERFILDVLEPLSGPIEELATGIAGRNSQALALAVLSRLYRLRSERGAEWQRIALNGLKLSEASVRREALRLMASLDQLHDASQVFREVEALFETSGPMLDISSRIELARLYGKHFSPPHLARVRLLLRDEATTVRLTMLQALMGQDVGMLLPTIEGLLADPVVAVRSMARSLLASRDAVDKP